MSSEIEAFAEHKAHWVTFSSAYHTFFDGSLDFIRAEITAKSTKNAKHSIKCHRTRSARMALIDTDPCSWDENDAGTISKKI